MAATTINSITEAVEAIQAISQPFRTAWNDQLGFNDYTIQKLTSSKMTYPGTGRIRIPFNGTPSSGGGFSGGSMDATPTAQNDLTAVEATDFKLWAGVTYNYEEIMDTGFDPNRLLDLVKFREELARNTMDSDIAALLFDNGSGSTYTYTHPKFGSRTILTPKPFYGIPYHINTGGDTGTWLGMNRASDTALQHYVASTATSISTVGSESLHLRDISRDMMSCASGTSGTDEPDLILTTKNLYSWFEQELSETNTSGRIVVMPNNGMGAAGFEGGLQYRKATIVWSPYCTSGYIYYINTKFMQLYKHKAGVMPGEKMELENQAGFIQRFYTGLQLISTRNNAHGLRYNITGG
jgi:hypothetical protein